MRTTTITYSKAGSIIISAVIATAVAFAEPIISPRGADPTELFLSQAQVVERGPAGARGAHAYLVTLSDGRRTETALVEDYTPYRYGWFESRDNFKYNVAAYKLDRLVGAGVVPCTVLREIDGQWASVTIWNRAAGRQEQAPRAAVFRALAANRQGGFSTGFAATADLVVADQALRIDDAFRRGLERLNRKDLAQTLAGLLSEREMRFVLHRRDRILERSRTPQPSPTAAADHGENAPRGRS
jgi:hypothetical protein